MSKRGYIVPHEIVMHEIMEGPIDDRHLLYDKEKGDYDWVVTGKIDTYEITQSHAGECGVKAVMARLALGDMSMLRDPASNLGDIVGMPDNIHELEKAAASGQAAVQVLSGLGLKDKEGKTLTGEEIAGLEYDALMEVLKLKVASEAPKGETVNE